MELHNKIVGILKEYYDIEAIRIESQTGGWSAFAFMVEDENQKYFLKVFDKGRPAIKQFIDAIDRYIPLTAWLHENTVLIKSIANPILTNRGTYKCEDDAYVYLLSEFIEGATIGSSALSHDQINELAKILGTLHQSTKTTPDALTEMQTVEKYELGFCDLLHDFLISDLYIRQDDVFQILLPHLHSLMKQIGRIRFLAESLKQKPKCFVLCHADAHNWNIMQGKALMLLDWECLRLAPPEQDLILNVTEPYAMQFLKEYGRYTNYADLDLDALEFYFLKRKLEDIWEWIVQLRVEGLTKSEECTLGYLKKTVMECAALDGFRDGLKSTLTSAGL